MVDTKQIAEEIMSELLGDSRQLLIEVNNHSRLHPEDRTPTRNVLTAMIRAIIDRGVERGRT